MISPSHPILEISGSAMRTRQLSISAIVGGGVCVSAIDGQRVYSALREVVASGDRAQLSFSGITRLTTAFLNAAVGQLYGEFTEEIIRSRLAPPVDAEAWQLNRLKLVVDRAKAYFSGGDDMRKVISRASEPDGEE